MLRMVKWMAPSMALALLCVAAHAQEAVDAPAPKPQPETSCYYNGARYGMGLTICPAVTGLKNEWTCYWQEQTSSNEPYLPSAQWTKQESPSECQ